MNKLGQFIGYFRGELGKSLLRASAGLMLLLLLTGAIGIMASYSLGGRIRSLVAESVPAILESSQLEPESQRLQQQAQQLAEADNLTAIASRQQLIEQSLLRMSKGAARLLAWYPAYAPTLQARINASRDAAEQLAIAAQQRQSAVSALRMARMRLEWLHSDLTNELRHLSEEQRQVLHQEEQKPSARLGRIGHTLMLLFQIRDGEQDITDAVLSLSLPSQVPLRNDTLEHLHLKTATLLQAAQSLPAPLTGGLLPLLKSLRTRLAAEGELALALSEFRQAEELARRNLAHLEQRLAEQNKQAATLSQQGQQDAQQQLKESVLFSQQAAWMVTLVTLLALLLTIWILFFLIGRKVISRLSLLGRNIEVLSQGQYDLPQPIGGQDEISRLGLQITRLADMMAELERTNALALIGHTDAALLICDDAGRICSINQAARRFYPLLEVGEDLMVLLSAEMQQQLHLLDEHSVLDVVLDGPEADNYMRFMARSFEQNGTVRRMVTLLDVSAQIRSSRWLAHMVEEKTAALDVINLALRSEIDERKRAQDSLVQATKFAVLGQTTTSLAHELNQPLAALTNYLYLAKLDISPEPSELLKNMTQGEKVLERMARLIRSYRTLGRHAPPLPVLHPVDFSQVLADICELLQGRIRAQQVELRMEVATVPLVNGEVVRLEQITLNLLGNALDALQDRQGGVLHLSVVQTGARVELYVADNGPGLLPDVVDSMFQPFFTSKKEGLGLGLSICRSLAQECHSEIRMANQPQGGALFILSMESQSC